MIQKLEQFVPSEVCLNCDGCCRFKDSDSAWRPKMSDEEVAQIKPLGLAQKIFTPNIVDQDRYIRTVPGCGEHFCSFFNPENHACAIYRARPFECELYPFVISRDARGFGVYVHLNCPHVEAQYNRDIPYVRYLQEYFARAEVLDFLKRNRGLLNDYSAYKDELEFLFPIQGLGA